MDRREDLGLDRGGASGGRASSAFERQDASAMPANQHPEGEAKAPAGPAARADAPKAETSRHEAPPHTAGNHKRRGRKGRKRAVASGFVLVVGGLTAYYAYHWWTVGRFQVSTDDAYVRADITILASKISGYVSEVLVDNNRAVKEGDLIARIEPGDYTLAVQAARDKAATQQATVDRIGEQIKAATATVEQAAAQVPAAEADLARATADLERQDKLAQQDYASRQKQDLARSDKARAQAALKGAQAGLAVARANVAVLEAQRLEAQRLLAELGTAAAKAERDLSFTDIKSPVDGVIGNKAVQVGQYVQPGNRLAALVPLDHVYVDANFKETQLATVKPGQPVEITVDAYPGKVFEGVVESISPASGALFSLLPPENATGNFTKIVQRVPVRVRLTDGTDAGHLLRPGMSVIATVDTHRKAATATSPSH